MESQPTPPSVTPSTTTENESLLAKEYQLLLSLGKKIKNPLSLGYAFIWILLTSLLVFSGAWFWMSLQIEVVLGKRVDEVGHQIAKISSIALAESIVTQNKESAQTLTQHLLEIPFVSRIRIAHFDGTEFLELPMTPQENNLLSTNENNTPLSAEEVDIRQEKELLKATPKLQFSEQKWTLEKLLMSHLPKYESDDVPFVVEILWQSQPVGWLQLTLNRSVLERDYEASSLHISVLSLSGFLILTLFGWSHLWRRHRQQKKIHQELVLAPDNKPLSETDLQGPLAKAVAQVKHGELNPSLHFNSLENKIKTNQQEQIVLESSCALIMLAFDSYQDKTDILRWNKALKSMAARFNLHLFRLEKQIYIASTKDVQQDNLLSFCLECESLFQIYVEHKQCKIKIILQQQKLTLGLLDPHHATILNGELIKPNFSGKYGVSLEIAQQLGLEWIGLNDSLEDSLSDWMVIDSKKHLKICSHQKQLADRQAQTVFKAHFTI